ncbi:MAG: N-acetylmannosaminyltransferase [Patescibacteria group bacterium]|nr:MAG: N-acetylmannosaminyltransferase [Patescibacteria group bacterium]GIW63862.1 MAG: N-acetylmannosaminyltransferase [Patescibacteria group bacterium]GIW65019.1 MAG: N-acetylmannosaminyltransferase [Patescibacteria group bacterium]
MATSKVCKIEGVKIGNYRIKELLILVDEFLKSKKNKYLHIVNMNPEIFIRATKSSFYRHVINSSDAMLIDGIGIKLLSSIYGRATGERLAGTDFAEKLILYAYKNKKRVFFLGGFNSTAKKSAFFFKKKYPNLQVYYSAGAKKIARESIQENEKIIKKIQKFKPDFLFVAYGPPWQEIWIFSNKEKLRGIVCMGVGGSFNFWAKKVLRAPLLVRRIGFEWLYRFLVEPRRLPKIRFYIYFFIKYILYFLFKKTKTWCFNLVKSTITKIKAFIK